MAINDPIADAIVRLMADGRPRTFNDIRNRIEKKPDHIRSALRSLVRSRVLRSKQHRMDYQEITIYERGGAAHE